MPENNDSVKIAEAGKKSAKSLSKEQIKGMSKYKAQQILNEKDPDLVKKIELEVAERAKQLKKKIMIAGFVVAVAVVLGIIYMQMKKNETVNPSDKYSLISTNETVA
ncbi:MAG: hypothetical protein NE334_17555 [Lentisphaeraceae bacterium]|nr:hypothetical protein [Lentisphaeraceae bacterium]